MKEVSHHLLDTVSKCQPLLLALPDEKVSLKTNPKKWCIKEIIGHLVDSASNNHHKFVRTIEVNGIDFPPYQQDNWVDIQKYQRYDWTSLLTLWANYNQLLAHIISTVPEEALHHTLTIAGKGPFELKFIMEDYVEHLKHHLKQALPEAAFLVTKFKMVY
jgi:hypothetical protein